jgi:hypothetical protein
LFIQFFCGPFEKTFKTLEMKKILYSLMISFLLTHQSPALCQTDYTVKATNPEQNHSAATVSTILNFNGTISKDRVLLNWTIDKNQGVDQFEVERSTDEKNFVMAGLVFGTDQPDKAEYLFYEKNKKVKLYYRLKIINKDHTVTFSPVITPEAAAAK